MKHCDVQSDSRFNVASGWHKPPGGARIRRACTERRSSPTRPSQRRRLNSAFTLVEILLALALGAVLMVALYAAFDIYGRVTTAGRDDIERAQLARSLLRMIELDIKSVVYQPPDSTATESADEQSTVQAADEGGTETGADTGGTTGETVAGEVDATDPAAAAAGSSNGVYGDSTTLVLHISRPQRNVYAAPAEDAVAQPGTSDLRSVSWFFAAAGAGGVQGAVAEQAAGGGALAAASGQSGLARMEGERLAITRADETSDTESLAGGASILAEEVTSLTFRYFDGVAWLDTWDCAIAGRLPQAIEVTLGLAIGRRNETEPTAYGESEIVDEELWRLVVPLPLAIPPTGEVLY